MNVYLSHKYISIKQIHPTIKYISITQVYFYRTDICSFDKQDKLGIYYS